MHKSILSQPMATLKEEYLKTRIYYQNNVVRIYWLKKVKTLAIT